MINGFQIPDAEGVSRTSSTSPPLQDQLCEESLASAEDGAVKQVGGIFIFIFIFILIFILILILIFIFIFI